MRIHRLPVFAVALVLALIVVTFRSRPALAADSTARSAVSSCDPNCYNTDYLFAATRELRDSTGSPTLVAVLSPLTVALDIGLLPFEILLGCFG
jgi:hypothetical protein